MAPAVRGFVPLYLWSILGLALVLPALAAPKPVLTITIRGDRVEYDHESQSLAVQGNVAITGCSDAPGLPTVALAAQQLEANLTTGHMVASDGVRLLTQQMAIKSEHVEFNFRKDEFTVKQGVVAVEADSVKYPGQTVRGFFFGNQISRREGILYVIEGRITTCDRARPHYSLGVQQLTFDTSTGMLTISKGRLRVHGLSLSIPGRYRTQIGGEGPTSTLKTRIPGYSSYDGLYLPYALELSDPGDSWQITGSARVGTKLRLPFDLTAERERERDTLIATLSRRQEATWDFNRRARLDRLPEVSYLRHLRAPDLTGPQLDATISLGHYRERTDLLPAVHDERLQLGLDYSPQPNQRRARRGNWWAAGLQQNFYGDGSQLRDLQIEAGGGRALGSHASLALWWVHHFASGDSPFAFDEVYARDELYALGETALVKNFSLRAQGRYDLDTTRLRDYSIRLSHRQHCLTWHLEYNYARSQVLIGLDLNGLTGGTAPFTSQPLIDPADMPELPPCVPGESDLSPGRLSF